MNINELTVGQSFTSADTYGTVYTVDQIVSRYGQTVVDYHIAREFGKPLRSRMVKPSLSTVFLAN